MFPSLSSRCVQLSSLAAHMDPLCYTYTRTHIHPLTHTLTLHCSSLPKTSGAEVPIAPRGRETSPSLPLPGCFSLPAAFPFPSSPPICPYSPRASQAGRGSGGALTSGPLRRGPALGYLYPQLLLASSAGREGCRGPADSTQMLAKCSYVITVFPILPQRPL